jgi:hypothetical protein
MNTNQVFNLKETSMKYLFTLLMLSCLFGGNAYAVDCRHRTSVSPPECFLPTTEKPLSRYSATSGAVVGGAVGGSIALALGEAVPIVAGVALLTGFLAYQYLDSFEGPLYEQQERDYKQAVDAKARKIRDQVNSTIGGYHEKAVDIFRNVSNSSASVR